MPTNEERRNVAKCLRGNPKDTIIPHKNGRNHGMGCHEAADRFWDICDRIKEAGKYDIAFSSTSVLADLIEPEPEPTFDEWLKDVKETCFANMEGCDEPEWSLFSTINDAIGLYLSGKSGYECRMIDYDKEEFCKLAEKENDGSCVGYARSEIDDEPCDFCKECEKLSLNISEKRWYSDAD